MLNTNFVVGYERFFFFVYVYSRDVGKSYVELTVF